MSNWEILEQVLEKAIQKAIDGGWDLQTDELKLWDTVLWLPKDRAHNIADAAIHTHCVKEIIYNHDFARALWGKQPDVLADWCYLDNGDQMHWSAWKFHLMMMVIADDPIEYLGEHL